ncbi:bifunctional metallophosphatase/5'-nucleotidase [Vibrio cholerae]|uniref:5'-nucleotidase C-terminal domain-containing protein n=1 Tax=Vibrio paracholerae TaxID=650003 RepID=UPI0019D2EDE2|nr:5'-nucleotidase C-terminal domain-containing protein [Vibrio paracholerae]MBN7285050.1 bifunctional metallophosphatase/5'-nucleotidase [Vibrio paracholerae]
MVLGKKALLACAIVAGLSGCNEDNVIKQAESLTLTIAHINDHHSKLDAHSNMALTLNGESVRNDVGGFAKVVAQFKQLENKHKNLLKLHAGDAITGTMFYSLFRQELPDALMMNQVCFDAFALGNHEFDDGNASLALFLDKLAEGQCKTSVLAANIEVPDNNPIAGKYKPYQIVEFDGHKIGVIGIDISSKTQASSSPSPDTVFLDETETAQKYINQLKAQGINKIVLLTHQTYENDVTMASKLTDVDVIVGGDSHTLLGDKQRLNAIGFTPAGDYPTKVTNADGHTTCVVQAWEQSKAVGELTVEFTASGEVKSCFGQPHILLSQQFKTNEDKPTLFSESQNQAMLLAAQAVPELTFVEADVTAAALLDQFSSEINAKKAEIINTSNNNLCNERVPGSNHASGSLCGPSTPERLFIQQHGSVMAHIVSKAFLDLSNRSDIAIQNTGGVRTSIPAGNVSVGHAFDVLPFSNVLVNLDMTGQEIVNTLEDAIDNVVANRSSGAFPAAANLRFKVDMNAAKGSRVTDVEARKRGQSDWHPIALADTYVVVTNDFIAKGGDRYDTMKPIYQDTNRREDTGLLYTDSLINYIKKLAESNTALSMPTADEMPIQEFIPKL